MYARLNGKNYLMNIKELPSKNQDLNNPLQLKDMAEQNQTPDTLEKSAPEEKDHSDPSATFSPQTQEQIKKTESLGNDLLEKCQIANNDIKQRIDNPTKNCSKINKDLLPE